MPRPMLPTVLVVVPVLALTPQTPKEPERPKLRGTAVQTPKVTGPIRATAPPGDPSRNYPYFSMQAEVEKRGYREEEFFIEGTAQAFMTDGTSTTPPAPAPNGPYAYQTRVIVRRPGSASRFNGTVILEWIRAGAVDQENDWWWSHEHLMRSGYAYVGVSAQPRSVELSPTGLKKWSPARYRSLDVTAGGKFTELDQPAYRLAFEIYSQAAQAARQGIALLGGLKVRSIIATGHSGSAAQLRTYYNAIHPLAGVIDGFVLHGVGGGPIRTDLDTPVWRLLAETDVSAPGQQRRPDTEYLRTWEVAGAAHAGWDLIRVLNPLFARDVPELSGNETCDTPAMSRVPSNLVQDAVYDWMKVWIEKGTQPPQAPPITMVSAGTGRGGERGVVARDEHRREFRRPVLQHLRFARPVRRRETRPPLPDPRELRRGSRAGQQRESEGRIHHERRRCLHD